MRGWVIPYEYDENLDPNSPQNKNPGAPQQVAGSSQVTGSQAPGVQGQAPAGGASAQPTSSGSYQNLQSYLSANDPNAFGQQFAGKVGQDVNQATQVQNQSGQEFKAQSDAGAVKPNQQLVDSAASDPYKFVQDPNNVSQFNAQKNASYSGPTSYQDDQNAYQKAASATTKAENTANAAQSEGGRFALLDNYFGNPNYTQGQKSLDNLLVQNSGDNTQQALAQAKQNADVAQSQFAKQGQDLSNYAAANRGMTETANANARAGVGIDASGNLLSSSPINSIVNTATAQANTDNTQRATDYAAAVKGFQNGQLTAAQFQQLGLTPGTQTWGVDPTGYLSQEQQATGSSVQTQDQVNRLSALSQLAGLQNNFLNPALAGTYDPSKDISFNNSGPNGFAAATQAAQGTIQPAVSQQAQLQSLLQQAQGQQAYWNNFSEDGGVRPRVTQDPVQYLAPYTQYMPGINASNLSGQMYGPYGGFGPIFNQIVNNLQAANAANNAKIPGNWNAILNQLG